jgi:hypothetical protein
MLIRVGYEIEFQLQMDTPMLAMLNVHPSQPRNPAGALFR